MASITVTFVDFKEGMQTVSFGLTDPDLNRIFEAYKKYFMDIDYDRLNINIPDDEFHDRRDIAVGDYTPKAVFERLADDIIFNIIGKVRQIEIDKVVENADVKLIQLKV